MILSAEVVMKLKEQLNGMEAIYESAKLQENDLLVQYAFGNIAGIKSAIAIIEKF